MSAGQYTTFFWREITLCLQSAVCLARGLGMGRVPGGAGAQQPMLSLALLRGWAGRGKGPCAFLISPQLEVLVLLGVGRPGQAGSD